MWKAKNVSNANMLIRTRPTTNGSIVARVPMGEEVELDAITVDSEGIYEWGKLSNHLHQGNWVALKRRRDGFEFFKVEEVIEESDPCSITLTSVGFGLESGQLLFEYDQFVKIGGVKLDIVIIEDETKYEVWLMVENASKVEMTLKEDNPDVT